MEEWNDGMLFLKEYSYYLKYYLPFQQQIFPMYQHPNFPKPIIPTFQL